MNGPSSSSPSSSDLFELSVIFFSLLARPGTLSLRHRSTTTTRAVPFFYFSWLLLEEVAAALQLDVQRGSIALCGAVICL